MAQQERPNAQRDQDRPLKPQQQAGSTADLKEEGIDLDQPQRSSQQTSQQSKSSKAGDENCGCGG